METPDTDNFLLRIAKHLMMNASFVTDLGLYHGKIGIVLFFAHYARYTGNALYDEFASELLDEIKEEIHVDTSHTVTFLRYKIRLLVCDVSKPTSDNMRHIRDL